MSLPASAQIQEDPEPIPEPIPEGGRQVTWHLQGSSGKFNLLGSGPDAFKAYVDTRLQPSHQMLGKLELVYDRNITAGDFDFRITSDPPGGYNRVLDVEGDMFTFHVEKPFVGEASVRFKETVTTPAGNWALDVGGVMFGPIAGRTPTDQYHVRFGGVYGTATGITRNNQWHTVKWKVVHDASLLHMRMHRYIEAYFDNTLVARHGYPSGIHSMKFVH